MSVVRFFEKLSHMLRKGFYSGEDYRLALIFVAEQFILLWLRSMVKKGPPVRIQVAVTAIKLFGDSYSTDTSSKNRVVHHTYHYLWSRDSSVLIHYSAALLHLFLFATWEHIQFVSGVQKYYLHRSVHWTGRASCTAQRVSSYYEQITRVPSLQCRKCCVFQLERYVTVGITVIPLNFLER